MKYSDISKEHRALEKMDRHKTTDSLANDDKFWAAHEAFKIRLRDALWNEDFVRSLNCKHLLQFIALCTTFRPYEPHVMLTCLSSYVN